MKFKKLMTLAMAGVLAAGLLAGCKSSGDNQTAENQSGSSQESSVDTGVANEENAGSDEAITIRLLTRMAGNFAQVDIYNDVIEEFKQKYPEVTIIDDSQNDEGAYNNILSTSIASGDMPNIFRIQGVANLSDYIDNGLLLDVSPYLEADSEWGSGFTEGSLTYYQVPGYEGTYAIPMESGLIGVYYNKELFGNAGIESFPETWDDLLVAIDKLNEIGVTPIAMGAQSTYMAGHLHNQIFYKWVGTEAAKALGNRTMNWTDKEVIQTLQYVKDLVDAKAFEESAPGITDDMAIAQFQQGQAAMLITGPWNISKLTDAEQTPVAEYVDVEKFPYFKEKPEYKDDDMQTLSPYMINGKLEGRELELTIELVKMLTGKEAAKRFAEETAFLIPRTDIELDNDKCTKLFIKNVEIGSTSQGIGVDVFDFDSLSSMQDKTRNSIVSLFINATAQEAAADIQAEIDNAK